MYYVGTKLIGVVNIIYLVKRKSNKGNRVEYVGKIKEKFMCYVGQMGPISA